MRAQLLRIASILLVTTTGIAICLVAVIAIFGEPSDAAPLVVGQEDALHDNIVTMGRSIQVHGAVRGGVMALGGDVLVSGSVEGDVVALGGSVIQDDGSHISGDVLVVGGYFKRSPTRSCHVDGTTLVYTGGGQQLRDFFANPTRELLMPRMDREFWGWRIAVVLMSFLVAIGLMAIAPGTISRASEQLTVDPLRIAAIGVVGALVSIIFAGLVLVAPLPTPIAAIVSGLLLIGLVVSQIFGRVVAYLFVGRWIQRHLLGDRSRSQTVALLLGVAVLAVLGTLPVIGALLVFATFILSLGIILTLPHRAPHHG